MAILKDLIVNGSSRFIGDAYFNTIKAGTWNGNVIDVQYGGTGKASITSGYLLVGNGTSTMTERQIVTSISSSSSTQIPTAAAVYAAIQAGFAANDAMQFAGTYAGSQAKSGATITGTFATTTGITPSKGCTWRVSSAGFLGDQKVEIGDLVIAITDSPGTTVANYIIIQKNMNVEDYVTVKDEQQIDGEKTFTDATTFARVFINDDLEIQASTQYDKSLTVAGNSEFNGNIFANNLLINGNAQTCNIGSSTNPWTNMYATNMYATNVYATKLIKNGSSDSYVLLGAGGHKALSQFAMANAYLPLTGGTLNGGESQKPLILDTSNTSSGVQLTFAKNGTELGGLGFSSSNTPLFIHTNGNSYNLLHSGNTYVNNNSTTVTINGTAVHVPDVNNVVYIDTDQAINSSKIFNDLVVLNNNSQLLLTNFDFNEYGSTGVSVIHEITSNMYKITLIDNSGETINSSEFKFSLNSLNIPHLAIGNVMTQGSTTRPIYFNNGTFSPCNESSITTANNLTTIKLFGTSASNLVNKSYIDNIISTNEITSPTSFNVTATLTQSTWTELGTLPTTKGSYIVSIADSNNNFIGTGVFTVGNSNNGTKEEIPLHCYGSDTYRLYLATASGKFYGASKESTGTSRSYTIKYKKLL